jgi:hypothetical protein
MHSVTVTLTVTLSMIMTVTEPNSPLQASLRELAGEEARDLPDHELELLMALQTMLEELDVQVCACFFIHT